MEGDDIGPQIRHEPIEQGKHGEFQPSADDAEKDV